MKKEILTIKELAEYLNCSISTIRNLLKNSELPFFCIGVKYYFNLDSIKEWIIKNEKRK